MKLVRLDGYQLVVEDELLLLVPFRKLYKADRSKDKQFFMNFLSIIYFTYDPRSDYAYIASEQKRLKEVCESNGLPVPKFNDTEKECIELYKKLTTTTSQELLRSTRIAVDKLREFLETVDLTATNDKGSLLYTPSSITGAIKQIPQLAKDIHEAEKAVAKELEEMGRARGGNDTKSLMDDGILL